MRQLPNSLPEGGADNDDNNTSNISVKLFIYLRAELNKQLEANHIVSININSERTNTRTKQTNCEEKLSVETVDIQTSHH
jgi:hypothetical protein